MAELVDLRSERIALRPAMEKNLDLTTTFECKDEIAFLATTGQRSCTANLKNTFQIKKVMSQIEVGQTVSENHIVMETPCEVHSLLP